MTERERLIEILERAENENLNLLNFEARIIADHLLANGVKVETPKNSVSLVDGHIEE